MPHEHLAASQATLAVLAGQGTSRSRMPGAPSGRSRCVNSTHCRSSAAARARIAAPPPLPPPVGSGCGGRSRAASSRACNRTNRGAHYFMFPACSPMCPRVRPGTGLARLGLLHSNYSHRKQSHSKYSAPLSAPASRAPPGSLAIAS
eukprot:scaffold14764_cov40-Phaeocystis_antarctica.AAC.2